MIAFRYGIPKSVGLFVCLFVFFDTLVSSTHTLPVNIFNLEGGESMLARDKGNFQALSVVGTFDKHVVFGGS